MKVLRGFTLIELLVTMVVAAILLAIAIPSYRSFVVKGARADAKSQMLNIAQMEERYLSNQATYLGFTNAGTANGFPYYSPYDTGNDYGSRRYDISVAPLSISSGGTGSITTSYLITAAPANGFSDPTCGSLTLDSIGNKGSTTSDASCW